MAARYAHINTIANGMRDMDRAECAAVGHDPKQALILGLRGSVLCWTALKDGRPAAMFGATPGSIMDRKGMAWMLGTDALFEAHRPLLTLTKPLLKAMLAEFPRLENWISTDNHASIRWLRRLGFQFDRETVQVSGMHFRRFSIGD